MNKTETDNNETKRLSSDVKWTLEGDFLCDGANVVMVRHLVLENFTGCVRTFTLDIDGEFCLSQQIFHPTEITWLLDEQIQVQRVDRLISTPCGQTIKQSSFFAVTSGCLLKEINSIDNLAIHLNPLITKLPQKSYDKNLHKTGKGDLQLLSKYFELKQNHRDDLKQQPLPKKSIVRDFVVCFVKNKPSSVLNFTLDDVKQLERDGNAQQVYKTADRRHQQN